MISISRTIVVSVVAAITGACISLHAIVGDAQETEEAPAPARTAPTTGMVIDLLANGLAGFSELGDADWSFDRGEGVITASSGRGVSFLMTREDYTDFILTAEFFVSGEHNSGVFFRCSDRLEITDVNCYEANIFDNRPDQTGRTGAIPNYAPPRAIVNAAGQWNTYEINVQGDHIVVTLNGVVTADAYDATHAKGPIALQWGAGTVMFRNVKVHRL